MKTVRFLISSVVLAATANIVIGHQDIIAKPTRIEFTFPKLGAVSLELNGTRLVALSLNKSATQSSVPKEELAGISNLQLETLHIAYGTYFSGELDGVMYESVSMQFGTKEEMQFGEYPEVRFTFHNGEYSHREVWHATDAAGGHAGKLSVLPSQWKGRKSVEPQRVEPIQGPLTLPSLPREP